MAHVYCPECGYNNPESAHFCAKCGAALVVPEEGESTEAFAAPEVPESLDPHRGSRHPRRGTHRPLGRRTGG